MGESWFNVGWLSSDRLLAEKLGKIIRESRGILVDIGTSVNPKYLESPAKFSRKIITMDINRSKVKAVRHYRLDGYRYPGNYAFILADGRSIPIRNRSIDLVTMIGLIGQLTSKITIPEEETIKVLKEATRILTTEGRLLIVNREHSQPSGKMVNLTKQFFQRVSSAVGGESRPAYAQYLLVAESPYELPA